MLSVVTSESSKRNCFGKNHEEHQYLRLINDIIELSNNDTVHVHVHDA